MRRASRAVLLGALIGTALALLAACGDSDTGVPTAAPTAPPTAAPTSTPSLPPGEPGVRVENAIIACREKDGGLLRRLVVGGATEEALQALFDRGSDVRLRRYALTSAEGRRATVTVGLLIERESGSEEVERIWELEQGDDGVWRFVTLPDCY